jgi:hypothetical protein
MRGVTADPHDGAKAPDGEDEIARLLAVPLGDFVEERKRLATQLKSLGRRDEAQEIAKLPKPSSALWAINQLARREPEAIRRLAKLTIAMQAGPRHAPDDYSQRLAEHRDVLRSLRAAAERILVDAKIGVNPALLERIIHTLRAGMAEDDTRDAIEKARLLREVGELDFTSLLGAGALGGEAPAGGDRAAKAGHASHPKTGDAAKREHASDGHGHAHADADGKSGEKAREREAAARAREEERERARVRAAAAREAEHLRGKADALRKRVRDDERAVEAARRALIDAETRLEKAQVESEELERALKAAQAAARGQSDET